MRRKRWLLALLLLLLAAEGCNTGSSRRVRASSITGTIVNEAGQPVKGAVVTITALPTTSEPLPPEAAVRDQQRFRFSRIPDGRFDIRVVADSYQPGSRTVTVQSGNPASVNVTLKER